MSAIFGLDFTSAPSRRKPITCAECRLVGQTLTLTQIHSFTKFAQFETFLRQPGPWLAGFDFPFGQPRPLIEALDWPQNWADYVQQMVQTGKSAFEAEITRFRNAQPTGKKHLKRKTDEQAGAQSPMNIINPPVGKMFFEGAPRLLAAGLSILPCHPTTADRLALETYPALVARKFIGREPYKDAVPTPRRTLLAALRSESLTEHYGLSLHLSDIQAEQLAADPTADRLDALLCAIQTAWAAGQPSHGLPPAAALDPLEGWIIDPTLT